MGSPTVSMKLRRLREQADEHPQRVFTTLHHLIDVEFLEEAYRRLNKNAAAGVDGVTAKEYEANLAENLTELRRRVHENRYRAQPVRRVWLAKEDGKERPLGIPVLEDKILQRAVAMVLECLYEGMFYDFSYGFRRGRSAHQALTALREQCVQHRASSILDADIRGYFDSINRQCLNEFLDRRVKDGVVRRLIGKWLKAGILEGERLHYAEDGTPQGGVISPLLANIYLHYVLDEWYVQEVQPRLRGRSSLVRFADDFVGMFEDAGDAERVYEVLPKRFARFGLTIHPEKTRLVPFRRPPPTQTTRGGGLGTFDFLGQTHYWSRSRKGSWVIKRRTARKRQHRAMRALWTWCRKNRHAPVHQQHRQLSQKLHGHYGYYGIRGNYAKVNAYYGHALRAWRYWLGRRSRKGKVPLGAFFRFLERYPLPRPRIVHAF